MTERLVDRLPDMVLVLVLGGVVLTFACVALLVAAQRANVARSLPWARFLYGTVALGVVWVLIR